MATKTIEVPAANRTVTSQDNMPPIERAKSLLEDLKVEAENWFDGKDIENEEQAAQVARILDAARKAKTRFDNDRKAEKKPFDDLAKSVDAAWKPILADCDRIGECAKRASTKWLIQLDEIKRAREAEVRRVAEEKEAEARRLAQENDGSLAATMSRDYAIEEAKKEKAALSRAEHDKANAKGEGMSRAVGLRTVYRAEILDRRELLHHIMRVAPEELEAFTLDWAKAQVRSGKRAIPGVRVHEDRVAA